MIVLLSFRKRDIPLKQGLQFGIGVKKLSETCWCNAVDALKGGAKVTEIGKTAFGTNVADELFLVSQQLTSDLQTVKKNIFGCALPRVLFEFSAKIGFVVVELFTNRFGR